MPTSVVPALIDRIVAIASAIPGVNVTDGDVVTQQRGTFLMVGWDDPDNDSATSASSTQSFAGMPASARDEEGTITCLAIRSDGDRAAKEARDAAASAVSQLETLLRADANLGGVVPGLQWVRFGSRYELRQWLSEDGAVALITFDIAFRARI